MGSNPECLIVSAVCIYKNIYNFPLNYNIGYSPTDYKSHAFLKKKMGI